MMSKTVQTALLIGLFYLSVQPVLSQTTENHISKRFYTGDWESPTSWEPVWPKPAVSNVSNMKITVNGYITVHSSLTFASATSDLVINDTLVIQGELYLGSSTKLTLNDNAVLIVRGDLTIGNNTISLANGTMVIMGNVIKLGSVGQGGFTSNDNPVGVFIGGSVPGDLKDSPTYPVLDAIPPFITTPYPNSGSSFGDMLDVKNNPVNDLIADICGSVKASGNSPVCPGSIIELATSPGNSYSWRGPDNFKSSLQNPSISKATYAMAGTYLVNVFKDGCNLADEVKIVILKGPVANAGSDKELNFVNKTLMTAELMPSEAGEWSIISGSGTISDKNSPETEVTNLGAGQNVFLWTVKNEECEASDEVTIKINELFVPSVMTPNSDGKNDYFEIKPMADRTEIIIFNRWGIEEYSNSNYLNNWDGRNKKGIELPGDTYFYVVKFENGLVRKGTILIKR